MIAHPDDEAMFFAPALTALTSRAGPPRRAAKGAATPATPRIRLLCLSTGDAAGLGRVRARELVASARTLGVRPSDVTVLDDPRLRDGMTERWDHGVVAEVVAAELRRSGGGAAAGARRRGGDGRINDGGWAVLTFDGRGVSGHPNHRDTSAGVMRLAAEAAAALAGGGGGRRASASDAAPIHSVWQLRSEPLALKFLGPLGAVLAGSSAAVLSSSAATVVVAADAPVLASLRAMRRHASQWVWFRWLFVAFSTYGWVNVLERVVEGAV